MEIFLQEEIKLFQTTIVLLYIGITVLPDVLWPDNSEHLAKTEHSAMEATTVFIANHDVPSGEVSCSVQHVAGEGYCYFLHLAAAHMPDGR